MALALLGYSTEIEQLQVCNNGHDGNPFAGPHDFCKPGSKYPTLGWEGALKTFCELLPLQHRSCLPSQYESDVMEYDFMNEEDQQHLIEVCILNRSTGTCIHGSSNGGSNTKTQDISSSLVAAKHICVHDPRTVVVVLQYYSELGQDKSLGVASPNGLFPCRARQHTTVARRPKTQMSTPDSQYHAVSRSNATVAAAAVAASMQDKPHAHHSY